MKSTNASAVELRIPGGPGIFHEARWYPHPVKAAALVLHLHAGAFVAAPEPRRTSVVEQLFVQAGASVVSLRYPLAPAHPFPEAVNAAYASLLYLSRERRRLSGARTPILVSGV